MKRKVNKFDDFVNEEFDFSIQSFKNLLNKVKGLVSRKQMDEFIQKNQSEIKDVEKLLIGQDGKVDYGKALQFVKESVKKKK